MGLLMPLLDASELIEEVFSRAWKRPERMTVDTWADAHRTVYPPTPSPGPWSTDRVPYLRRPMRDFTDPLVNKIVLMFGTQSAKTEFLLNCLGRMVDLDPDDILFVIDNTKNVREFSKRRLMPMLKDNPRLRRHLSRSRFDTKLQEMSLRDCTLYLTGANSAGNLSNKPVRLGCGDEIDKWPQQMGGRGGTEGSAVSLLQQRTDAYGDEAKTLFGSTPTDEMVGIHREFVMSDQAEYWVPCPHCGHYQHLHFYYDGRGGVRWEGGSGSKLQESELERHATMVRRTAWYECESVKCRGRIESSDKALMLMAGLWLSRGQTIEVEDQAKFARWLRLDAYRELTGRHVSGLLEAVASRGVRILGEVPITSTRGYHACHLESPFRTFGHLAADFVKLRGDPDRGFVNSRLGEPWRLPGERSEESDVITLATTAPEGEQPAPMGVIPLPPRDPVVDGVATPVPDPGVLTLVGAIDVQTDGVWYVVRGFGEREQSWLIDCGFVACPEVSRRKKDGSRETPELIDQETGEVLQVSPGRDDPVLADMERENWAAVEQLVRKVYPRADGGIPGMVGATMPVAIWGVDSGDRTIEVYRFCERMGRRVMPVKGSAQIHVEPHQVTILGRDTIGPKGREAAEAARRRFRGMELVRVNVGFWKDYVHSHLRRRPPMHGAWRWPIDLGSDYPRHVTSEHRVIIRGPRGSPLAQWQPRPGRRDNHLLDADVYACALADLWGMKAWTRHKLAEQFRASGGSVAPPTQGESQAAGGPAQKHGVRAGRVRIGR